MAWASVPILHEGHRPPRRSDAWAWTQAWTSKMVRTEPSTSSPGSALEADLRPQPVTTERPELAEGPGGPATPVLELPEPAGGKPRGRGWDRCPSWAARLASRSPPPASQSQVLQGSCCGRPGLLRLRHGLLTHLLSWLPCPAFLHL